MKTAIIFAFNFLILFADGRSNKHQSRIINGVESIKNSHPFMVSIQLKDYLIHVCGGSIINSKTVLTAAHCVLYPKVNIKYSPSDIFVVLGEHNIYRKEGTEIFRDIEKIIVNDLYQNGKSDFDGDLALLIMREEIVYTPAVQPICLYAGANIGGFFPTVAGWGYASDGLSSKTLQEIQVPVILAEWCEKSYGKNFVDSNMICAGYPWATSNIKDICKGDSGGPLFAQSKVDGTELQIGLVSFNSVFGCALRTYPSSYTKISSFLYWIYIHTDGDVCLRQ